MVSRGWIDVRNRHSISVTEPISPRLSYQFGFKMQPRDYVFKAGHRIGLVLLSTDTDYTLHYPAGTKVTATLGLSSITLPLV